MRGCLQRISLPDSQAIFDEVLLDEELAYAEGAIGDEATSKRSQKGPEDGKFRLCRHPLKLYWRNGQLKRECLLKGGVRHGWDRMWNEQGVLVDEGCYEEGKPVGAHRRWDSKGRLVEEIVHGEQGKFDLRQWDREGVLRVEAIWVKKNDYRERVWDRFQEIWIEKKGYWDGKRCIYC